MKRKMLILSLVVIAVIMLSPSKAFAADPVIDETCYVDGDITYIFSNVDLPNHKAYRNRNGKWASFQYDDIKKGYGYKDLSNSVELADGAFLRQIKVSDMKSGNKKVTFKFKKLSESQSVPGYNGYQVRVYSDMKAKHKILSKNFTGHSEKLTFKEVEVGKTYYVKVRGYNFDINGHKAYGPSTKLKAFVVY